MGYNFDQKSDYSKKELFTYLRDTDVPVFVKQAEVDDAESLNNLPKTAFADEYNKAYPINSAARVYVSNAYFLDKKAELEKLYGKFYTDKVQGRIKQAADLFGITEDLKNYNSKFEKKASEDYETKYVYTAHVEGSEYQQFPVKTAKDLVKAADYFIKYIEHYPYEWRKDICSNFCKMAEDFGIDEMPEKIQKYAGRYFPDINVVKQELWRRSTKLASEESKKQYLDLAEKLSESEDVEDFVKVAEICYYTEKMEGLYNNKNTSALLPDPIDTFFVHGIDKVSNDLDVVKIQGEMFKFSDLKKISNDDFEKSIGFIPDFSNEKQAREELETLPKSDLSLLKEITSLQRV